MEATAVVGVVGTLVGALGGAGLGAFVTWKVQERQHTFEERTKFHSLRVETYTQFAAQCDLIYGEIKTGEEPDLVQVTSAYDKLRLIATEDVAKAGSLLFFHTTRLIKQPGISGDDAERYTHLMVRFLVLARDELGVEAVKPKVLRATDPYAKLGGSLKSE